MSVEELEDLHYRRSDMLGSLGVSADFRDLLASHDRRARLALEVFCYQSARHIGSLTAALNGIDGIVFAAGVGENAAQCELRSRSDAAGSGWNWMKAPSVDMGR
jgi:acetate kinase